MKEPREPSYMDGPCDSSGGLGLDVTITLPGRVVDQIEAAAKERGETFEGRGRVELLALVEAPGSDGRIRAVPEAPTDWKRHAAADRLTDADWERLAKGIEFSPADLEAEAAQAEMQRRAREPDPDR